MNKTQLTKQQLDRLHELVLTSRDHLQHFKEINNLILEMKSRVKMVRIANSKKCQEYYKKNRDKILKQKKQRQFEGIIKIK